MVGAGPVGAGGVGDEQDPEAVVPEATESVGQAAGLLDEWVDGFGAAVGHPPVAK